VLNNVIERHAPKRVRTLVFCNTVKSCRAVEYALTGGEDGGGLPVLSYHGELNSKVLLATS
jgi:superfamily II DNA/RNA helicase